MWPGGRGGEGGGRGPEDLHHQRGVAPAQRQCREECRQVQLLPGTFS